MNGRLFSMIGVLLVSQLSAADLVHAQSATGIPPTLELGEVRTQPVEPNASSSPAVGSSGSDLASESRPSIPAPEKRAGANSNPAPAKQRRLDNVKCQSVASTQSQNASNSSVIH